MLLSVYDDKNEMFEVRPDNARRLVIENGWSMEPKTAVAVAEPVATVVAAPDEVPDAAASPDVPDEKEVPRRGAKPAG